MPIEYNRKKIFLDTNILIYQTFEDFDKKKHDDVSNTLEYLSENDYSIYISSQVPREFFAIATNEKFFGRPLSVHEAVLKTKEFENNFTVLYESDSSIAQLNRLVLKYQIKKQNIHDTNIAAMMITNDIREIFTLNVSDFTFYEEIEIFKSMPQLAGIPGNSTS